MKVKSASKPKKVRIALNGLGRIGRVFLRIAYNNPHFEIVAAHSRGEAEQYAHLLKYDSTYGVWEKAISVKRNKILIDKVEVPYIRSTDGHLPWKKIGVDFVLDATGKFTKRVDAQKHLDAGARFVMASAPMDDADETFVYGANHGKFDPEVHKIISGGSCTTICSTLTIKVLEEAFGIRQAYINTIHAVTNDQQLLDSSHKDVRRARSATESIIPTSTGVSNTITKLYPQLKGKVSAISLRVPVVNPSLVVLTAQLKKSATPQALNKVFQKAASGELSRHLSTSTLPLVSIDFRGNPHGAIVDLLSTEIVNGNFINVLAWYDNEWGYVQQMVYLLEYLARRIAKKS